MSQKFITSAEKTAKKGLFFEEEKPKKFTRKRSERQRSFDSKRSKEDSVCSHYIKNPTNPNSIHINLANDSTYLFFDQLNTSAVLTSGTDRKPRKAILSRSSANKEPSRQECTLTLKIKILQTQIKAKQGQCQRLKLQVQEQRERRRKVEFERKAALKESTAFQKQNDELMLQVKKLTKEKEILNKQIQFLEKINYDQKTRNIQSFREKHMQEEIFKLKEKLNAKKDAFQIEFQKQLGYMKSLKEAAEEKFRSMESLVDVQKRTIAHLKEDLFEEKMLTKQRIIQSDEYRQLRQRFKKFIDQYRQVRSQNNNLKTLIQGQQTQLVLSQSQRENN